MRKRALGASLLALSLAVGSGTASAQGIAGGPCRGEVFDPVSDPNWNNMFPITIAGAESGSGKATPKPPLMHMDPVCTCPGMAGASTPGVGMTYWEPTYLAEVATTPGCMSTLGGKETIDGYDRLASTQSYGTTGTRGNVTNMQIHWWVYPLFASLNMMSSLGCMNTSGYNLGDMTEVDPTWQDSAWSSVANPESGLFANIAGIMSCIPDAVSSSFGMPLDTNFWCQGGQGVVYPLVGWGQSHNTAAGGNLHILGKYMQRKTREAGLLATIGPWAQCTSMYLPNWIKSQYRIDPVAPVPSNRTVVLGMPDWIWSMAPPTNTATRTDSAFLVWVGKQCCAKSW